MKTQVRFKDKLRGENSAGRKRLRQVKYKDVLERSRLYSKFVESKLCVGI